MNLFLRILRRFFILKWEEIIEIACVFKELTCLILILFILISLYLIFPPLEILISIIPVSVFLCYVTINLKRWLYNNWKKAIEIETKK